MNNPDKDRLLSFESHTDTKKPDVKMVWLLNLIPYTGAGYFYALGASKAIKPMIFIWIFLLIFGPGTLLPMYFILSVLGTAHILNKHSSTAKKLRQATPGKNVESVLPGQQIPMTPTSEYSLSTLERKAKKASKTLKRMSAEDDEAKSRHAFETFEYKAQAAEKMLKARNDAANSFDPDPAINFAPAAAPQFSDEEADFSGNSNAPQTTPSQLSKFSPGAVPDLPGVSSDKGADQQTFAQQQSDSSDYINQVSKSDLD